MKSKMKMTAIAAGVTLAINPAYAAVLQVTTRLDGADGSLRSVVAAAASGDSITFAPWLHGKRIELDSPITIDKTLSIKGDIDNDNRPDITIDGQHKTIMFTVTSSADLTLYSVHFENGMGSDGGSIHNDGLIHIYYSVFNDNEARRGGAIFSYKNLFIDTCTFKDNVATKDGGAVHARIRRRFDATPSTRIEKSTFSNNWAQENGGAILNVGNLNIYASTFSANRAMDTLTSTSKRNQGSAIWTQTSGTLDKLETKIYDSTFIGNKSHPMTSTDQARETAHERMKNHRNNGGTIYNFALDSRATVMMKRTVVAKSTGRNCAGSGNFTIDHVWSDDNTCAGYNEIGTDSGDPHVLPLSDHGGYTLTHFPKQRSGLVNAAGTTCADVDQRGAARIHHGLQNTQCDIGSVERATASPRRLQAQSVDKTIPAEYTDSAVIKKTLNLINSRVESLTAEKTALENEKETILAEKATLQDEKSVLTEEKAQLAQEKTQLAQEKSALQTQLTSLQSQLATVNAQLSEYDGTPEQLQSLQAEKTRLESEIQTHKNRIAELEDQFIGSLHIGVGDAGDVKLMTVDDSYNMAFKYRVIYKVGGHGNVIPLAGTTTRHVWEHIDGSKISSGRFRGPNGIINWRAVSVMVPGSDFHVTRYSLSSAAAFGDVALGVYADIDVAYEGAGVANQAQNNALIIGGENHARRLMVTDSTDPDVGVAIGIRGLKNAQYLGWRAINPNVPGSTGDVLNANQMTGISEHLQTFTPDQETYPGTTGAGPNDIAITQAIKLKHSAKLATFEITQVAAPNGVIE